MESAFKRHEPLYLKYRPQSLGALVGQEGVRRTLENAITHNRLTHAYLFTGPRGTGKTSTARILAKSLNCKKDGRPTVEPCQTCSCCVEITNGNSPAVFEIDAASNNSVEDARVLIERAPLKAVGGEFKVYIIDECHMLSKDAFNALLKTIEQPPPGVVFILATTEEHKVLPTIVSRCQRLMFKLINQESLTDHLRYVAKNEDIEIEDEALRLIARRSGGGLRDALSNLDQASLLSAPGSPATVTDLLRLLGALNEDILLDMSLQIAERRGQDIISSMSGLLSEGREPQVILQELSRHFLALMKAGYMKGNNESGQSLLQKLALGSEFYINGLMEQSALFERSELSQIIEQLERLEGSSRRNSQPAMHLEIGLLGLCHRHDIHLLKNLADRVNELEEKLSGASSPVEQTTRRAEYSQRPQPPQQAQSGKPDQENRISTQPAAYRSPESTATESALTQSSAAVSGLSSVSRNQSFTEPRFQEEKNDHLQAAKESEPAQNVPPSRELNIQPEEPRAKTEQSSASEEDSRLAELNSDIDYVWQQVLDELQRRHIPTFSLTSTHAFPLAVSAREFSVGVLKENFQKMLENKIDHLKAACHAVTQLDLNVKIRVADSSNAQKKTTASLASTSQSRREPITQVNSDIEPDEPAPQISQAGQSRISDSKLNNADNSLPKAAPGIEDAKHAPKSSTEAAGLAGSGNDVEVDKSLVKEAYKLFEGPGSRRIN